jgi:hypothetical protein
MDALTLLREVSEAYRNVQRLALEAALIQESGDENANQRSERRVRFFYAAPDRFRYEPCGKGGILQVADGKHFHSAFTAFFGRRAGGRHLTCTSVPAAAMGRLPHLFNREWPVCGEVFLFHGLDEHVAAEILREEEGCHVISVTYEPPARPGLVVSGSAVLFWVSAANRMVMRQQGEIGHRPPTEDEVTWSRHAMVVRQMRVNEPLPEETFQFTPPPDATLDTGIGGGGFGIGGSGFIDHGSDEQHRLEHRSSYEWEGDTLLDRSKWKIRGMTLTFERRLTFSDDGKELRVAERIAGPKEEVKTSCKLPVG